VRRFLIGLVAAMALGLLPRAQEVVVFRDFRSMRVLSHRAEGPWTYLRVAEGEMAVPTSTIAEFRKEPAGPSQPAPAAQPAQAPARNWNPEPAPPPREPEPQEDVAPPPDEPPPPPELPPPAEAKQKEED